MSTEQKALQTLQWVGQVDGYLTLIDQTQLPIELVQLECRRVSVVFDAIKQLQVRGAPAIGIAAAYGTCISAQSHLDKTQDQFFTQLLEDIQYLATSRPTAVNLFWALDRMKTTAETLRGTCSNLQIAQSLLDEALQIHDEDREMCRAIGRHGAELLESGMGVLTHCNAGGLATADYGTALAVIFSAVESGKQIQVFVDETRPLLQGSRLTAWELVQRNIPAVLICDSMAAQVMREGKIQAIVTGADRIASNGDVANKIGTYSVAQLAAVHKIPFYVAAPSSTFDFEIDSGDEIVIEQRDPSEVIFGFGRQTAPLQVEVYNPAFDVTPAELITAIICEKGVIQPVTKENIAEMLN